MLLMHIIFSCSLDAQMLDTEFVHASSDQQFVHASSDQQFVHASSDQQFVHASSDQPTQAHQPHESCDATLGLTVCMTGHDNKLTLQHGAKQSTSVAWIATAAMCQLYKQPHEQHMPSKWSTPWPTSQ